VRWTDIGIITSTKSFRENGLIVTSLTQAHGLYKGLLRRSSSASVAQPGTIAQLTWSARLQEHLGTWALEPTHQPIALLLNHPLQLSALNAACSLIESAIPEREKVEGSFPLLFSFVKNCSQETTWRQAYLSFERNLLSLMGFEMKLEKCAATNTTEELFYISPKSGGAVSKKSGEPYKEKLFPLSPAFISPTFSLKDFQEALTILSHFWERFVLTPHGTSLPPARDHLISAISRRAL